MLEWKILAAAFSALLVVSMVLVGNTGVKDLFGSIVGRISDWMAGGPISLPGGKAGTNAVTVTLYPKKFTLKPETRINFSLGESAFENFNGEISADFNSGRIYLKDKGSSFSISSPIQPLLIQDLKISRLSLKEMKFTLMSVQSNITNENGTLDIQGFSGVFSVSTSSITLSGNVTKVTGEGWNVG